MASPILACRGRRVDRGVASCFRGRRSGLGFVRSPSTFRAWKGSGHSFICAKAETKEAPRRGASFVSSHGGRTRARTWDPLIKSQLLYQLSYAPHLAGSGAAIPSRISLVESSSGGEIYRPQRPTQEI